MAKRQPPPSRPLTPCGKYHLPDARDREMVLNPMEWPLMVLPMKRSHATGYGMPDMAVLEYNDGTKQYHLHAGDNVNLNLPGTWIGKAPTATYTAATIDDLLNAGWRVD